MTVDVKRLREHVESTEKMLGPWKTDPNGPYCLMRTSDITALLDELEAERLESTGTYADKVEKERDEARECLRKVLPIYERFVALAKACYVGEEFDGLSTDCRKALGEVDQRTAMGEDL